MKNLILLTTIFSMVLSFIHAQTTSQIEGYLEVYHPEDTTSIYIGREAGKLTDPSVVRNNTILGNFAGAVLTTGGGNSFFGKNAGKSTNTGFQNSFYGEDAGFNNTTAFQNSFFGMKAGFANTSGSANSFFGMETGLSNTTGFQNSFFGHRAGKFNTTGLNNTFAGHAAGFRNTTGAENSFFGMTAGRENTTGFRNSYFGKDAGYQDTTGSYNSYFGYQAGLRIIGSGNVSIGARSGPLSNQSVGSNRLFIDNDSTNNPLIYGEFDNDLARINGYLEVCLPGDSTSIYLGKGAGRSINPLAQQKNTILGNLAGASLTSGLAFSERNSLFGYRAGTNITSGTQNSFFGNQAGEFISGSRNVIIGSNSGPPEGFGVVSDRLYIDVSSTLTPLIYGEFNNDIARINGYLEVCLPGDSTSMYIGKEVGRSINPLCPQRNTVLGNLAGSALSSGLASSERNSIFGYAAGTFITSGAANSFFGARAGEFISGSRNICIGSSSGPPEGSGMVSDRLYIDVLQSSTPLIYGEFNNDLLQINGTLTMGNTNYFGGNDDGVIRSSTANSSDLFLVSNDAVIIELDDDGGEEGNFEIKDSQNRLILKILEGGQFEFWNSAETQIMHLSPLGDLSIEGKMTVGTMATAGAANVCRNSTTGELTLCSSSIRYKEEIEKNTSGLQLISKLQPVNFRWKESGEMDLGLIAEEVAEVEPLLVIHNDEGEVEGVKYDRIGVLLVNAVKEQQAMIEALQEENKSLKEENTLFQQKMTEVLDAQQEAIEALQQKMEQSFRTNSSDND